MAKRIIARFQPQAWMRGYAVNVDPEGETTWDVTDAIAAMGREAALALQDDQYETDDLRDLPAAPAWVREYVMVQDSIQAYFSDEGEQACPR